ncbi:unnamed protein product [Rangifer tarandus platyrhynchus]|uniref:Uncharacterized protein n=1 Tax=Rangifer tarandus platyrhynchus TaxID=3082113 RepID=A0AC59ZG88_RANTA
MLHRASNITGQTGPPRGSAFPSCRRRPGSEARASLVSPREPPEAPAATAVSRQGGHELRRPEPPASRKQTNNPISAIHKCVNTSAWKPICQRLTYDFEALTKAVERRCPVVVGFRSGSGHSTCVSFELWFLERGMFAQLAARAAPGPSGLVEGSFL